MQPHLQTPLSSAARTPRLAHTGGTKGWSSMSFLLVAAGVQLFLFNGFISFFFSSEQHRSSELTDMQGELHRLRTENSHQAKRLIHANKRMLRYEADIRAELDTALNRDEDRDGGRARPRRPRPTMRRRLTKRGRRR